MTLLLLENLSIEEQQDISEAIREFRIRMQNPATPSPALPAGGPSIYLSAMRSIQQLRLSLAATPGAGRSQINSLRREAIAACRCAALSNPLSLISLLPLLSDAVPPSALAQLIVRAHWNSAWWQVGQYHKQLAQRAIYVPLAPNPTTASWVCGNFINVAKCLHSVVVSTLQMASPMALSEPPDRKRHRQEASSADADDGRDLVAHLLHCALEICDAMTVATRSAGEDLVIIPPALDDLDVDTDAMAALAAQYAEAHIAPRLPNGVDLNAGSTAPEGWLMLEPSLWTSRLSTLLLSAVLRAVATTPTCAVAALAVLSDPETTGVLTRTAAGCEPGSYAMLQAQLQILENAADQTSRTQTC